MTAAMNAVEELSRREQLQASGLPQPSRARAVAPTRPSDTFGDAAQPVIERLTRLRHETFVREGRQKANKFDQHLGRLQNVLLKEFGDIPVREITGSRVNEWMRSFRVPVRGGGGETKHPAQNTVGNFNATFQLVMAVAVENQWIKADDVPTISKEGFNPAVPRPWFSAPEMEVLRDHMTDAWIDTPHDSVSSEVKYLLRALVALGSCTGIRPGLEFERIRANQIMFERDGGAPVIRIPVPARQGKYTKPREVYVFENDVFDARDVLVKLLAWQKERGAAPNGFIFARPSSGLVPAFAPPFRELMIETKLLIDPETGEERKPYSLRHYFATQALLRGEPDHIVAKWMGTSVEVIDKHYNKIKLRMKAAQLAGTSDAQFHERIQALMRRRAAKERLRPPGEQHAEPVSDEEIATMG